MNVLISIPSANGYIRSETVESLMRLKKLEDVKTFPYMLNESLIYDARDNTVKQAVECKQVDYVWFIDSDVTFKRDTLEKLIATDADIVTGLYPYKDGNGLPIIRDLDGESVTDVSEDDKEPFEIGRCGMGMCLIKIDVLKEILEKCDTCFAPMLNLGEDYSFCARAHGLGYRIYANPSVRCGHVGFTTFELKQ